MSNKNWQFKAFFAVIGLILVSISFQGCHILLRPLAQKIAKNRMQEDLRVAPPIDNPAVEGRDGLQPNNSYSFASGKYYFKLLSYSKEQICFEMLAHLHPDKVRSYNVSYRTYQTPEDTMDKVKDARSTRLVITEAQTEMRPVVKKRTDNVRDGRGVLVGTVEREETVMEAFYITKGNACFSDTSVLSPDSKYLMVYVDSFINPEVPQIYGVWSLR